MSNKSLKLSHSETLSVGSFNSSETSLFGKTSHLNQSIKSVRRSRKRNRKVKDTLTVVLNVIEALLELYREAELKYSYLLYKYKRLSLFYEDDKTIIQERKQKEEKDLAQKRKSGKWLLEKETISSLKKMMTRPKNLKNVDYVINNYLKVEKSKTPDYKIIYGYLNRFEEDSEMLKDVHQSYELGLDDTFTAEEMKIIKWREKKIRKESKKSRNPKVEKNKNKSKPKPEKVLEWKEFVTHPSDHSTDERESSSTVVWPTSGSKEDIIHRLKRHLRNWLQREYQISGEQVLTHQFNFYEAKHPDHKIGTYEKRLQVSVRFVSLAQMVYPEIDGNQILSELATYFGNVDIPTIAKLETSSMDETDAHKKNWLLKKVDAHSKKNTEKDEETYGRKWLQEKVAAHSKKTETENIVKKDKATDKRTILKRIEHLTHKYDLKSLYDKFVQADLPNPYDVLYVQTLNGLFEIYEETATGSKLDNTLILKVARNMSHLIFDCVVWLIDSILRSPIWQVFDENMGGRKTSGNLYEESRKQKEDAHDEVKKRIKRVIKYQNLQQVVSKMLSNEPNLFSS